MLELDDAEGVIVAPHQFLDRFRPIQELNRTVRDLVGKKGPMTTSQLWKELDCHLWELSASLRRLKEMGLIEERDL